MKLLGNWKVILLLACIALSIIAISPRSQDGVAIRGVEKGSAADLAGIEGPAKNTRPLGYELITSVDGQRVGSVSEYYDLIERYKVNDTLSIKTSETSYFVTVEPRLNITVTGNLVEETYTEVEEQEVNGTLANVTITKTRTVNETIEEVLGVADIGLGVSEAAQNNIKKGLDLQGGVRVLLQPKEETTPDVLDRVKESLEQRLNAFGLNDVIIRISSDLSGNKFVLVEIAGLQQEEISELIASQGKFEAKILNQTAFTGGEDITYVCRSADCSGIDPQQGCGVSGGETICSFFFTISLSPQAAQQQADLTKTLDVVSGGTSDSYLSEPIELYLDDQLVDTLQIGASLRGRPVTDIQISGSGSGSTREQAIQDSLQNMRQLQAILETGSLPVELEIVKIDTLSPVLGKEFLRNALLTGLVAILAVGIVLFGRYRKLSIALPVIITNLAEIVILLGVAAVLGTNLDLAAIAGIIIVVGTGVDHLIIISDEVLRKGSYEKSSKQKIKEAFFVIFAAFFTTIVAMLPLWFAGAGILRGFATTTIYGIAIGVLITRPAFAAMVEYWVK